MTDKPKDKSTDYASATYLLSLASEIGFKLALPLLIFLLVGIKLDQLLGTKPLFILTGVGLSLASSVLLIAQMVKAVSREQA